MIKTHGNVPPSFLPLKMPEQAKQEFPKPSNVVLVRQILFVKWRVITCFLLFSEVHIHL